MRARRARSGRLSRSVESCSLTSGGPSSLFFRRYRNDSGNCAAASIDMARGARRDGAGRGAPSVAIRGRRGRVGRVQIPSRRAAHRANPRQMKPPPPGTDRPDPFAPPTGPCCTVRVHFVIVGCGRVGSGLALTLEGDGHSVAILDQNPRAFRRLTERFQGQKLVGSGFDRDDLESGRRRAGRRAGGGHERRQHQHPDGPHRPGELRDRPGGRPHLRPATGRDLPAARDPDRGHGPLDHRPGTPEPRPRSHVGRVGRRQREARARRAATS